MGFYISGITCLSGLGIIATSNDFKIILQPVGNIIPAYTNYVFKIECNRSTGLFYQWYKNSVKVINATTPNLTVFNATSADNGDYYCVVNNDTISKRSDTATLSVLYSLIITKQPVSIITNPLSTVSFDVDYTGSELVRIQWYYNNSIITGATSKKLTIPNVNKVNEGNYYCILSNYVSTVTSNTANLLVRNPVVITTQPVGAEVLLNTEFTVNCCVTGTGPITHYWVKDDVKIVATQASLGTTDGVNVSGCFPYYKIRNGLSDYGNYKLVAYNLVNSVTSNVAPITRKIDAPTIVTDITDISCEVGDNIEFSCSAVGTDPISYQWYKSDNTPIAGQTLTKYSINDVQLTDAKVLYCKATNIGGSVSSSNAILAVSSQYIINVNNEYITFTNNVYWKYNNPYIWIITHPQNKTSTVGSIVNFTCLAGGADPLTYIWYCNGNLLADRGTTLSIIPTTIDDGNSYFCRVVNPQGTLDSNTAYLTITITATIATGSFFGKQYDYHTNPYPSTGIGANARIRRDTRFTINSVGNLYIAADYGVTQVTPLSVGTKYALYDNNATTSGDGANLTSARFVLIGDITIDSSDNLYVIDTWQPTTNNFVNKIRKITPTTTSTILDNATYKPIAIAVDSSNVVYFSDSNTGNFKKISGANIIDAFAKNNAAASVKCMAFDSNNNFYYTTGTSIIKLLPDGTMSVLASGFVRVESFSIDDNGIIYVGDAGNKKIKRVNKSGIVSDIHTSSSATAAATYRITGVAVTKIGNLVYFYEDGMIRRITIA